MAVNQWLISILSPELPCRNSRPYETLPEIPCSVIIYFYSEFVAMDYKYIFFVIFNYIFNSLELSI